MHAKFLLKRDRERLLTANRRREFHKIADVTVVRRQGDGLRARFVWSRSPGEIDLQCGRLYRPQNRRAVRAKDFKASLREGIRLMR